MMVRQWCLLWMIIVTAVVERVMVIVVVVVEVRGNDSGAKNDREEVFVVVLAVTEGGE